MPVVYNYIFFFDDVQFPLVVSPPLHWGSLFVQPRRDSCTQEAPVGENCSSLQNNSEVNYVGTQIVHHDSL